MVSGSPGSCYTLCLLLELDSGEWKYWEGKRMIPLGSTSWLSMKRQANELVRLHPVGFAPLIYLNYRRMLRLWGSSLCLRLWISHIPTATNNHVCSEQFYYDYSLIISSYLGFIVHLQNSSLRHPPCFPVTCLKWLPFSCSREKTGKEEEKK